MPRLRLLSANLLNNYADAVAFGRLVADLEPDVVAVQELGPAQAEVLAGLVPHGTLAPATNYRGMGIALRQPGHVTSHRLGPRAAWVAEVSLPGAAPVTIVNVHIVAPHLMPTWRALAGRRAQLRALLAYLDAARPGPLALVGDFNSTPIWPLYRRLATRLDDAAVVAARGNGGGPGRTWGPWPGAPRLLRIDHAFVRDLVPVAVRVAGLRGSDHSALVVDLDVPPAE
jgi:endonuclease/exonuclease/phosphatase (EEP) superfamily protein YafD